MTPADALALVLAAAVPDTGPDAGGLRRGVAMLVLLGAAGFAVIFAVAAWSVLRAVRRARKLTAAPPREPANQPEPVDPWAEAGRRARPEDGDHWLEADPNDETRG